MPPTPHVRKAGKGPAVICLHSSASSSGQWRGLMDLLSDRFEVVAPDLYGAGRTAAWSQARPMALDDEAALLAPLFEAAGDGVHLVGHSFGGAVALRAAYAHRRRLASVVLYEPVLFSVLMAHAPDSAAATEISAVRDDTTRLVEERRLLESAQRFVDYWLGEHSWTALPEERKAALATAMPSVIEEWHAAFHEPLPLRTLASIDVPTLILTGSRSTAAARAVASLLSSALPRAEIREVEGVGHMAPVTHPDTINPLIEAFLVGHLRSMPPTATMPGNPP